MLLKMSFGKIFHNLSGIAGMSLSETKCLNPSFVLRADVRRRLFRFLNLDHPYTLTVEMIKDSKTNVYYNGLNFIVPINYDRDNSETQSIFSITRRYKTLREACYDRDQLLKKRYFLQNTLIR